MFGHHSKQRIMLQALLLALQSHTEAIMHLPQIVTYAAGEKGIQRRTKLSFGRTMMQAMELLRLAKRPDEATLNSEEIKPVAIAIIKLCLSECISKGVSQSVSQSVEN